MFKTLDEVMKPGAILASQHLDARRRQDRRVHQAPAGRDRHALLQPGQRDEAARGRARREDRQGRARHRDGSSARRSRRPAVVSGVCDGFIGNRMIEQYIAPGRLPAGGRRDAAAGRQGDREVRLRDGAVPHGRPGRQRHRLVHPQAPLRREARHALQQDRRPAVRAGPLRPEDRRRLVRLPGRQARRDPDASSSTT